MITLLSIVVLGFFLGMRHATGPDHVIAVTTIVGYQQSIRHAALMGPSGVGSRDHGSHCVRQPSYSALSFGQELVSQWNCRLA
jgi:hypothetical protein